MNFYFSYPHGKCAASSGWSGQRLCASLRTLMLLAWLSMAAGFAHAQGSVRASIPPVEYAPFEVVVQTNNSYCFDPTFPLFGEVQYSGSTLTVVLTHLSNPLLRTDVPTTCGRERSFRVSGLPRGAQTIRVDITDRGVDSNNVSGAHINETITANLDVAPFSATASLGNFWTGRFRPALGDGPWGFVLTPGRFAMFSGQWDWLEVGSPETGYTFKAFALAAADRPPDALAPLYQIGYPAPFGGVFWTVELPVAQRLSGEWAKPVQPVQWAVGRLRNGVCPIGMSPVYQTFNAAAVSHRWTQSRSAYAQLISNGYQGDGPVWCAPAFRGE